jgi:hypothetical protein
MYFLHLKNNENLQENCEKPLKSVFETQYKFEKLKN